MTLDTDDTICAIATAPGGAVRGIVRISGPRAMEVVGHLSRPEDVARASSPCLQGQDGRATPCCLPGNLALGSPLGDVPCLFYVWPTERSYTRQPSVELHLPGSPPILQAALNTLCTAGARLARPGEFTLRAFLAGRLDLTQAEAVLGVIDATSQRELKTALTQLAGGLARPLHDLRERLLDLLAHLEAGLDFADEDIQFIEPAELVQQLGNAANAIALLTDQLKSRSSSDSLPRVVLTGAPNAGKSSLLNALANDAAAIVSEMAGTTRDFLTCRVTLGGQEVLLIDTAGLSDGTATEAIDEAAQALTRQKLAEADLVVLCIDGSQPWMNLPEGRLSLRESRRTSESCHADNRPQLTVITKCDLAASASFAPPSGALATSSRTGTGLDELRSSIAQALTNQLTETTAVTGTAERCRESLQAAHAAVERAQAAASASLGEELVAAEVRLALEELGAVVGAVYTDDILDRVFSRFCIGK